MKFKTKLVFIEAEQILSIDRAYLKPHVDRLNLEQWWYATTFICFKFNGKRVEAGDWIVTFPNGTKEIFSNSSFIELFEND